MVARAVKRGPGSPPQNWLVRVHQTLEATKVAESLDEYGADAASERWHFLDRMTIRSMTREGRRLLKKGKSELVA